jgi:dipeptidyl-peptidase-3
METLVLFAWFEMQGTASSNIFHLQTSPESPLVFVLLHKLFSAQPIAELKKAAVGDHGVSTDEFQVSGKN